MKASLRLAPAFFHVFAVVAALSLHLTPALHAQSPTPTSTSAAPATPEAGRIHEFTITVRDGETKEPVAGAEVVCYEGLPLRATTDAAGVAVLHVPVDLPMAEQMQRFNVTINDPRYATRAVMFISVGGRVRETLPAKYEFALSRGLTIGGTVRDEKGAPVSGASITLGASGYSGYTLGTDEKKSQEYSSLYISPGSEKAPVTDAQGVWRLEHFPADVEKVTLEVTRPGGGRSRFHTTGAFRSPSDRSTIVDVGDLRGGKIALTAKEGQTLRGTVVDDQGVPVGEALITARDAATRDPGFQLKTDLEGKFELPHWDASQVLITASRPGFQAQSGKFTLGGDGAPAKLTLKPAQPLRLRLLAENDTPLAGAEVQLDSNPNPDHILAWKAKTDAEGRIAWDTAPGVPVTIWMNGSGYYRTAKLTANGTEQVIRFRKGAEKEISIRIKAVDTATGAPVKNFEVWRRMGSTPFKPWGAPVETGEFKQTLAMTDMPKGFVPTYRLQVRAAGYSSWGSDSIDFGNGDQDLTIKLTKGESTLADEPPPTRRAGEGFSGENNPALLALGASVGRMLETGDAEAFAKAAAGTEAEWAALMPKSAAPSDLGPLGADPARTLQRYEKSVLTAAKLLLAQARRSGVTPGRVRFAVKSIASSNTSSRIYKLGGQEVRVPSLFTVRLVLTGEPVGDASGKPLRGDYELELSTAMQLPAGWHLDQGVRWRSFPAGLADATTQRELRLANAIAPTSMRDQRTLSGADDSALLELGAQLAGFIRSGDTAAFLAATTLTPAEMTAHYARADRGKPEDAAEASESIAASLRPALASFLDLPRTFGADFADAKVTVKQILAERPRFIRYGLVEGLQANNVRVTLAVDSPRSAKSGVSLSGTYVVALGNVFRAGDRWLAGDGKIRWQEFPPGLLTPAEAKNVEFENYIAEHETLPPGHPAPEVDYLRVSDSSRVALATLRGKVVILEFWASWCGPCQEPMEKLQHLREAHPDWKDRVEILAVSIDDKLKDATDHLAKKNWNSTTNGWAGEGAWKAPSPAAFRVRGVPTAYVLDREGKVVKAGHPLSLNFAALVDEQLKK